MSKSFPIIMSFGWELGSDKQTMYFVFAIKTRHKSVSRDMVNSMVKSHEKKCLNYFLVTTSLLITVWWNVNFEEIDTVQEKWWILVTVGVLKDYI